MVLGRGVSADLGDVQDKLVGRGLLQRRWTGDPGKFVKYGVPSNDDTVEFVLERPTCKPANK